MRLLILILCTVGLCHAQTDCEPLLLSVVDAYVKIVAANESAPLSNDEINEVIGSARAGSRSLFELPARVAIGRGPVQEGLNRLEEFVARQGETFRASVETAILRALDSKLQTHSVEATAQKSADEERKYPQTNVLTHPEKISQMAVARNGSRLALVSTNMVTFWDTARMGLERVVSDEALPGKGQSPTYAFSSSGKYFVVGAPGNGNVLIFEAATGVKVATIAEQPTVAEFLMSQLLRRSKSQTAISNVAVSPQGDQIATSAQNRTIWIRELPSGEPVTKLSERSPVDPRQLEYSADGKKLFALYSAIGSGRPHQYDLGVWDLATKSLAKSFLLPKDMAHPTLLAAPAGNFVLVSDATKSYAIALSDGHVIKRFEGHLGSSSQRQAFSTDGKLLYMSLTESRISVWRVIDGTEVAFVPVIESAPFASVSFMHFVTGDPSSLIITAGDDPRATLRPTDNWSTP